MPKQEQKTPLREWVGLQKRMRRDVARLKQAVKADEKRRLAAIDEWLKLKE